MANFAAVKPSQKEILSQNKKFDTLISLINCCSTNIAKQTFYNKEDAQRKVMLDIHSKAIETSRIFYALMLLPDFVTDVNKKVITANLLEVTDTSLEQKNWENALILQSFSNMQPNRVLDIFNYLIDLKINNSRTRHLMQHFLERNDRSLALWVLKYKKQLKRIVRHAHLKSDSHYAIEFLMDGDCVVNNPLLENYKLAKNGDIDAIYKLPLTVARGLAAKFKIADAVFIKQYNEQGRLTQKEQRQQAREFHEKGTDVKVDLTKLELFDLFVYLGMLNENNSLPIDAADLIRNAAKRAAKNVPYRFDNTGIILDTSLSMSGAKETKNHPLYRALAVEAIIKELSDTFIEYRMHNVNSILPKLSAQSNYATCLLNALKNKHKHIFILGDGYENTPYEGAINLILTYYKQLIDTKDKTTIVHFNPVFASESKNIRSLFLNEKYHAIGIRNEKSLTAALFLALSKQDVVQAIKAYFTVLLRLQNKEARDLQPKNVQLLLE